MKCRHCGTPLPGYAPVSVGRRHGFCGKRCRDEWLPTRVHELETALNSIFCRTRGRARAIARDALIGNLGGR